VKIDFAPIEFEEGGDLVKQLAPVKVYGTIAGNEGWDVVKSGCDTESGPNYLMGAMVDGKMIAPQGMIEDCRFSYHRVGGFLRKSSWQLGATLVVNGDGTVRLFPPNKGTVGT
jgi:hypothetical protein